MLAQSLARGGSCAGRRCTLEGERKRHANNEVKERHDEVCQTHACQARGGERSILMRFRRVRIVRLSSRACY